MPAIVYKSIKPSRLKEDALRLELLNEMRKVGTQMKADFEKTTKTWKNKPKFEIMVSLTQPGPTLLVFTENEIYGYVSKGTGIYAGGQPYEIWAGIYTGKSNKKALAFSGSFSPKTRPGVIGSSGGSSGGKKVVRPYVVHPGIKPRGFEEAIQKKWKPKFKREMEAAMRKAIQKSGHAL